MANIETANAETAIAQMADETAIPMTPSVGTARHHLLAARAALDAEIRGYPTPIAGCDTQYNHLLAERRRIQAALRALEAEVHIPTPRAP